MEDYSLALLLAAHLPQPISTSNIISPFNINQVLKKIKITLLNKVFKISGEKRIIKLLLIVSFANKFDIKLKL